MKVDFCGSCRRLILADFRYCPYCGAEKPKGPGLAESLEEPLGRLEGQARRLRVARHIEELAARLDGIELEMEALLSSDGAPKLVDAKPEGGPAA